MTAGLGALAGCGQVKEALSRQGQSLLQTDHVQAAVDSLGDAYAKRAARKADERKHKEEIARHAREAKAHLALFEYEAAEGGYKEAYRLSLDPAYLLELAEVKRATGQCNEARLLYERYLDATDDRRSAAADRQAVLARMKQAAACQAQLGPHADAVARHYREGVVQYNLGEYDRAVESFKEAYRLSRDASYLFNIAQAHRLAGRCREALTFYRRVLSDDPRFAARDRVEARIAEVASCARVAQR